MATTRDQRPANARYYRHNRAREIERVRSRQGLRRDELRSLRSKPCMDCRVEFLPHQMDFDHRDPGRKTFRLTAGGAMLASPARLMEEMAKCDVVCANCHRLRTWSRNATQVPAHRSATPSDELRRKRVYWRNQAQMLDGLKDVPCVDCGGRFAPCVMDFDHRDARTKAYTVSRMIGRAGTAKILAEIAKCDIVCANCHRDRTYRRREAGSPERE
jgi:hypothetical protein